MKMITSSPSVRAYAESLESRMLLAVAGTLDSSFSGDGKAATGFGPGVTNVTASDVAVQLDGKTVVVGRAFHTGGQFDFAVARFNGDGSLDTSFGPNHDGRVLTHVGKSNFESQARAVAIQSDGKIVVVGEGRTGGSGQAIALARFLPDGSLDKSFSSDGKQILGLDNIADGAFDVAIQTDGKIVVAAQDVTGFFDPTREFAVARFNTNGSVDQTFGDHGTRNASFGADVEPAALAIDLSGTKATNPFFGGIVIVGKGPENVSGTSRSFAIARLTPSGFLDHRFGPDGNGKLSRGFTGTLGDGASDVLIQPNGAIVVSGTVALTATPADRNFAMLRVTPTGAIDTSFGGSGGTGLVMLDIANDDRATSMLQSSDGGILLGGISDGQFAIAKFSAQGVRDGTFGSNGIVRTAFGSATGINGMARVPLSKRFVAAGGNAFATARYLDTGAGTVVSIGALDPDATEGGGGFGNGSLIVARTERLPVPTRILLNVGGTATAPPAIFSSPFQVGDYTAPGINFTAFAPGISVTIPANQTFVIVPVIPIDDTKAEGPETAIFSIKPDPSYEIGTNPSAQIDIADNEQTVQKNLSATADAFVRDGTSADTNFGTLTELQVKTGSTGVNRLSYLKFDLSSLSSSVNSAKLQLFGRLNDTQNASVATSIFSVQIDTWTETGITFNNKPAPDATPLSTVNIVGTSLAMYEFDVTSFIKSEKAAGHNTASFALKNLSASNSVVIFNSREAASGKPNLVVEAMPVGTFKVAPKQAHVSVGQTTNLAVTWTVPSGSWRQLKDIQLRLRGEDGASALIDWNEAANTFSLFNPATGKFGKAKELGSDNVLSNRLVDVLLKTSSTKASGPTSPTVTVTFSLRFNHSAAGHHFKIEAAASNDLGVQSLFARGGSVRVI